MTEGDETFRTIVIAWAVVVTIVLCVLLPYTVNLPSLPAGAYKIVAGQFPGLTRPDSQATAIVPAESGGLLIRYDFEDEGPAGGVVDRSGNRNSADVKGVFVGRGPGHSGNRSLRLPGTGVIWTPANPAAGRTNVTFAIWFTGSDPGSNLQLAGAVSSAGLPSGWTLGTIASEIWDAAGEPVRTRPVVQPSSTLPQPGWNFKTLVYNGTHVVEYLNGGETSIYSASGRPVGGADAVLSIGTWQPFGRNYAGLVDEFRIYDRAFNRSEVRALYQAYD